MQCLRSLSLSVPFSMLLLFLFFVCCYHSSGGVCICVRICVYSVSGQQQHICLEVWQLNFVCTQRHIQTHVHTGRQACTDMDMPQETHTQKVPSMTTDGLWWKKRQGVFFCLLFLPLPLYLSACLLEGSFILDLLLRPSLLPSPFPFPRFN